MCFESFDELLLLKRGGYCIYFGPLGDESCNLVDYFEAIPGVPRLQAGINPATWMLDVSTPGAEERIGEDFAHVYLQSDLFRWVIRSARAQLEAWVERGILRHRACGMIQQMYVKQLLHQIAHPAMYLYVLSCPLCSCAQSAFRGQAEQRALSGLSLLELSAE